MSKKNKNTQTEKTEAPEEELTGKKSFIFMYIAMGCFAAGCILFGLSFAIKNAGVHLLIASMISELASVSFINAQKKKVATKACTVITILSYIVMAAALIIFVIGIGVGTTQN